MAMTTKQKMDAYYRRKKEQNLRRIPAYLTPQQIEKLDSLGFRSREAAIQALIEASDAPVVRMKLKVREREQAGA